MAIPATQLSEMREHQRSEQKLEVSGTSGHQFFTGFSENISAGGLFIATYQTLPLGTRFDISFVIPGIEHTFDAACEVRWVREYSETVDMVPGMGVRFLNLTSQETQLLDEFVRRTETMFYED